MTDRPIIFSAQMVQALLAGRKTQTRRIQKGAPIEQDYGAVLDGAGIWRFVADGPDVYGRQACGERYAVGDRLYVRETVACGACAGGKPSDWSPSFWRREQGSPSNPNGIWYAADDLEPDVKITDRGKWVPSIHMPRWCSRITLTVTEVRVQRLQDISEEDAAAEGARSAFGEWFDAGFCQVPADRVPNHTLFSGLWGQIHGAGAWAENPWVVAVSFTVQRGNIDALQVAA